MRAPDAIFSDPRQAVLYDFFDGARDDLAVYLAIAREVDASLVADVGCGTGCLALLLAQQGIRVIGVDPAGASLDVARTKPGADQVTWIEGDATALATHAHGVDLAVMTGNVAQVFIGNEDWHQTLGAIHECLRPEGWFVFETRRPEARAWEEWDVAPTRVELPDGRTATISRTVTKVDLPLVTFCGVLDLDGEALASTSTLRFREREEIESDLVAHGFDLIDVREAPDRPGKEFVFLTQRR